MIQIGHDPTGSWPNPKIWVMTVLGHDPGHWPLISSAILYRQMMKAQRMFLALEMVQRHFASYLFILSIIAKAMSSILFF